MYGEGECIRLGRVCDERIVDGLVDVGVVAIERDGPNLAEGYDLHGWAQG